MQETQVQSLSWEDPPEILKVQYFLGGPGKVIKNPPYNTRDIGSIPGPGTQILHRLQSNQAHAPQLETLCPSTKEWCHPLQLRSDRAK